MDSYDVAIVGSGYGGSVMAARLAGKHRVLLVERGRRWQPDDFPRSVKELAQHYQRESGHGKGLWAMRLGKGVGNAYVSAYGGSSVVNYGITIQPEDHVFDDWPVSAAEMAPYYARAREVLRPSPNPRADALGDKAFLDLVEPGTRHDLENTIDWAGCDDCGNCPLGCRRGAKRSLDYTYLALAEDGGATVRTDTTLVGFAADAGGYRLRLRPTGEADGTAETVRARRVVLATGTYGTLDMLLRHRDRFPLSAAFGARMSMNGDGLAFLYNTRHQLDSSSGAPISTAALTPFVDPDGQRRTLMVMSGRIPRGAMLFSAVVLGALAEAFGRNRGPVDSALERAERRLRDLLGPSPTGALAHTFMYKLDGQDSARGRATWDARGRAVMDWVDYQEDPLVRFAAEKLEQWSQRVGGRLIPNLGTLPGMRSFGVHALGGCRMADSALEGVTDSFGRVRNPHGGFYPGLRIMDASILPGATGVPPSLTIAALAERSAEQWLAEGGT